MNLTATVLPSSRVIIFVSEATNFRGGLLIGGNFVNVQTVSDQPLPSADNLLFSVEEESNLPTPDPNPPAFGNLYFVGSYVNDRNELSYSGWDNRAASFSMVTTDMANIGSGLIFMLNKYNYNSAHKFLIPRAVSYSAGLIDYFFRGRISAEFDNVSHNLKITNQSSWSATFKSGGYFEIFYEDSTGTRVPALAQSLGNALILDNDLAVNEVYELNDPYLSNSLSGTGITDSDRKLVILFTGVIGQEQGLATTVLDRPEMDTLLLPCTNSSSEVYVGYISHISASGNWIEIRQTSGYPMATSTNNQTNIKPPAVNDNPTGLLCNVTVDVEIDFTNGSVYSSGQYRSVFDWVSE